MSERQCKILYAVSKVLALEVLLLASHLDFIHQPVLQTTCSHALADLSRPFPQAAGCRYLAVARKQTQPASWRLTLLRTEWVPTSRALAAGLPQRPDELPPGTGAREITPSPLASPGATHMAGG